MRFKNNHIGFIVLTAGVFIILFFAKVFQHGLFFDGTIYASIARNIAIGKGSVWAPMFSETIYASFYEHPPFVFGLEAVFMKFFDNAFYSEKLFSFFMSVLVISLIALIWRQLNTTKADKNLIWLPLLFWIITPKNSWTFTNNLLEMVMTVFSLAACYFLLKSRVHVNLRKLLHLLIAAFLIVLTFLSKGFPGLFPLGFFALYYLVFHSDYSIKRAGTDSFLLLLFTGLLFAGFFFWNPAAYQNISNYINTQVLSSLNGQSRVGSRWVIPQNLRNELLPILIIITVLFVLFRKQMWTILKESQPTTKWFVFFLSIGLSASIPLMVSPKLSSFYLVPSLPYFAIGFAFLIRPFVAILIEKMNAIARRIVLALGVIAVVIGISMTIFNAGTIGRDHDLFADMEVITAVVGKEATLSLDAYFSDDWTTIAYFQRYHQISFDRIGLRDFILLRKGVLPPNDYAKLDLPTKMFDLAERN